MKEIPLTRGYVALVDDDDYERVAAFKWGSLTNVNATGIVYAVRKTPRRPGPRRTIYMHRFVIDAPHGSDVDHRDGNGLNCCKANLRLCDKAKNQANRGRPSQNKSGYKGVHWTNYYQCWLAKIQINNKSIYIGRFSDPIEAALAYDSKARELFGEFARPNFP